MLEFGIQKSSYQKLFNYLSFKNWSFNFQVINWNQKLLIFLK